MKKFLLILLGSLNVIYGMDDQLDKMERGEAAPAEAVGSARVTGDLEEGSWLLFPEEELPERFAKMGETKKMFLELAPLLIALGVFDTYFNLRYHQSPGQERFDQMMIGYKIGKKAVLFTRDISFLRRILGGISVWGIAVGITVLSKSDIAVTGFAMLLYTVRSFFAWYAQKTGRLTESAQEFRDLPVFYQRTLLSEFYDKAIAG